MEPLPPSPGLPDDQPEFAGARLQASPWEPGSEDFFSGGRRWELGNAAEIDWSVAWSLPLAGIGVLVVALGLDRSGSEWMVALLSLWCVGLLWQAGLAALTWHTGCRTLPDAPAAPRADFTVTVGGVWVTPPPRFGAAGVLLIWLVILLGLVAASSVVAGFASPGSPPGGWTIGSMPSLGGTPLDRWPAAAAWLWAMQALWQLLPVPGSLGRAGWSAAMALAGGLASPRRGSSAAASCANMRRLVNTFAILILITSVAGMHQNRFDAHPAATAIAAPADGPGGQLSGPARLTWQALAALFALSGWLFVSSRSGDLLKLQQMYVASPTVRWSSPVGVRWRRWRDQWGQRVRERHQQRKLKAAIDREYGEARDVSEAEHVLQKLHAEGMASLSRQERELLQRVSQAARRQRDAS